MTQLAPPVSALVPAAAGAFEQAAAAGGLVERTIAPAGVPVRVRIAGATLAERLLPALPAPSGGSPRLTLLAFDGRDAPLPPSPWGQDDLLPAEEVRGATDGAVVAAVAPAHGTVSVLDRGRATGVFWARDAAAMPDWEDGSPLRHLLRWGLADHGLTLLHGAAVAPGVLLLGEGGSGKSTVALACLAAGRGVVADDYCLVAGLAADGVRDEPLQGPLVAHGLYAIGKLDAASLALLPALAPLAGPPRGPKHKSHLALADRYADQLPLRALVLPRVAPATGEPEPLEAGAVVRRVLASTLQQMPGRRAASVAALSALARALPAYELAVGSDLDTAVARIGALA